MIEQIERLQAEALAAIEQVSSLEDLAAWRAAYTGKKGQLSQLSRQLGQVPAAERPALGQRINSLRQALLAAEEEREGRLKSAALHAELEEEEVDVSLPGRRPAAGRLHPTSQALRRIEGIFAEMGFQVFESPEVESDLYNFELLNMPEHHPARDMWDTFYVETPQATPGRLVMRTHTSPGQIYAMRQLAPNPIRVILPGKVFRYEQVTARSEMMFYQVEGLAVGPGITMADLKGTLIEYARRFFTPEVRSRFRPSYFPFTEPSLEMDIECFLCDGKGCRVCKGSGWLEILGGGMVHPVVLRNGGYDPEQVSGFAFGMGVERQVMLSSGVDDIRWFYSNDERFLRQFG